MLDAGTLFALQLLQFLGLDYYVLIVFKDTWYSRYPNALFLVLNIVLTLLFYHTFVNCYKEYKYERSRRRRTASMDNGGGNVSVQSVAKYPVYLNCITWAVYVTVLFGKIVLIFTNKVIKLIDRDDFMGPQMLKVGTVHTHNGMIIVIHFLCSLNVLPDLLNYRYNGIKVQFH